MLRSIRKAYDIIKSQDAETDITMYTIRLWCKAGKIKYLTAGTKILIDMESLMDFISMKNYEMSSESNPLSCPSHQIS